MNLSTGLRHARVKLPEHVQRDWRKCGQNYEDLNGGSHPPFQVFVNFLNKQAKQLSNKHFDVLTSFEVKHARNSTVRALQTDTLKQNDSSKPFCKFHNKEGHNLENYRIFSKLSFNYKKKFVFESKLCFICLGEHIAAKYPSEIKCKVCGKRHVLVMHKILTQLMLEIHMLTILPTGLLMLMLIMYKEC